MQTSAKTGNQKPAYAGRERNTRGGREIRAEHVLALCAFDLPDRRKKRTYSATKKRRIKPAQKNRTKCGKQTKSCAEF
jgi:hypothetical protein